MIFHLIIVLFVFVSFLFLFRSVSDHHRLVNNSYGGMDDGQLNHMGGMQLADGIDFNIENLDMYTSSFN